MYKLYIYIKIKDICYIDCLYNVLVLNVQNIKDMLVR